jgi:hypothetical protein
MERASKTADHAIRNSVPRKWLHVNLLTQLTIDESILDIKLRNKPVFAPGSLLGSLTSGCRRCA